MNKKDFRKTEDGCEITRRVQVAIYVSMSYEAEELPSLTEEQLDRDSIENFLAHPAFRVR